MGLELFLLRGELPRSRIHGTGLRAQAAQRDGWICLPERGRETALHRSQAKAPGPCPITGAGGSSHVCGLTEKAKHVLQHPQDVEEQKNAGSGAPVSWRKAAPASAALIPSVSQQPCQATSIAGGRGTQGEPDLGPGDAGIPDPCCPGGSLHLCWKDNHTKDGGCRWSCFTVMARLVTRWLQEDANAIHVLLKPNFRFQILIFSKTNDVWVPTTLGCWAVPILFSHTIMSTTPARCAAQ